jgi:Rnl2 family RNA ligase
MGYSSYSKIENHYDNKHINGLIQRCPEVIEMDFQITEKIDGSNFQICITRDSVRYGKRTSWLTPGEGFYDWENTIKKPLLVEFITKVQADIPRADDEYSFYGELFGPGVQKRIQYGPQKDILLFDMKKNGQWVPAIEFERYLLKLNCFELHVPILAIVKGLEEAIAFETKIPTKLFVAHAGTNLTDPQEIEGVVIKPLDNTLRCKNSRVIIKKKNDAFKEKMNVSTNKKRIPKTISPLQEEFLLYINSNRMAGIVSKYGEPEEMKDIGKYISLLANDAFNDFAKDQGWELANISKQGRSAYVGLVGAVALPLIKAYL